MARRKVSKRVKVDNRLILLAASAVLVLLFVLFWPSLSAPSSEKTQQLEERTPVSVPGDWKVFRSDGFSVRYPKDWFIVYAGSSGTTSAYIISNFEDPAFQAGRDRTKEEIVSIRASIIKGDFEKEVESFKNDPYPKWKGEGNYTVGGNKIVEFFQRGYYSGNNLTKYLLAKLENEDIVLFSVFLAGGELHDQGLVYEDTIRTIVGSLVFE